MSDRPNMIYIVVHDLGRMRGVMAVDSKRQIWAGQYAPGL